MRMVEATDMLTIRPYEPTDDFATIWDLHVRAMQVVGAYLGDGSWDDDLRDIQGSYPAAGGVFLVGLVEGQIVAMGALRYHTPEQAEIKRMRVHPAYQGRGFGQQMLAALEAAAVRQGFATLILETGIKQLAAQHVYRKNGYRETHRDLLQGKYECIWFEKRL